MCYNKVNNFMTETTGKSQYELGNDISGRPEGVSEAEWQKILESARNQVIAERTGKKPESHPGQVVENNPGEPTLVSVPENLKTVGSETLPQAAETQANIAELRKNILERALNILNGNHSTSEDLKTTKSGDVAAFVDQLNSLN